MPTLAEIRDDPNYVNANPATKAAIFEKYSAQDANYTKANPETQSAIRVRFGLGEVSKVDRIPQGYAPDQKDEKPNGVRGLVERAVGDLETAASMGTGALGAVIGQVAGVGRRIADGLSSGITGTTQQQNMQSGMDTAGRVSSALTYEPRTQTGKDNLETIGNVMSASRLAGLNPAIGNEIATIASAPRAAAVAGNSTVDAIPGARTAMSTAQDVAANIGKPAERPMAGVGSAMTDAARLRTERAQSLPVPLDLTKGMATREFEQQRFERETAKAGKVGEPIRERHADLNEKILQNFDSFIEDTGAEAGGLRAVGQIVNDAVVAKAKSAKAQIKAAYTKAEAAGETAAPVKIAPLSEYIASHEPEAINAPIISSAAAKLKMIEKDGVVSVNDLEELRKMVGNLSGKDATNAHFGKELKGVIDQMTEGVGGAEYQRARSLRAKYAKEFEDVGVIDKLMRTKPGTKDRAVAYEDVFQHSILSGSLDDVRAMRKTLQTAGTQGEQAWRELQGQTIKHIQYEITKNVQTDIRGNRIVSASRLDNVITELDKDGKLEFVFGKRGAQQLRDVNEVSKDVMTFPPGSVNTSGTASVLLDAIGSAAMGRLPTAAMKAGSAFNQLRRHHAMEKRVRESLSRDE